MTNTVILGLGSNLGDRESNIQFALEKLENYGSEILSTSKIIETEPYGFTDQPEFLNCAAIIKTCKPPLELLDTCKRIETEVGRIKTVHWGPRVIDLDILFYNDIVMQHDRLTIPHPELHKRKFVLDSLLEICPNMMHPVLKTTIRNIYNEFKAY